MSRLHLPKQISIQVLTWTSEFKDVPFTGPPLALEIRTFARSRNDYHLGPFFSDPDGRVMITRALLDAGARAQLDWGLMDYAPIDDCFALVEIVHWSADDVQRAIEARSDGLFSDHERTLWGSLKEYLDLLRSCANRRLSPVLPGAAQRIRSEWDGSQEEYKFEYRVHPSALA